MSDATQTPALNYAAHILKRLTDPSAIDPTIPEITRLAGPMLDLVMAVYSEGKDRSKRKGRLNAELLMRGDGLDLVLPAMIEAADPKKDLTTISMETGWKSFDLVDVLTEEIPPVEWIAKGFLQRPSLSIWYGRAKNKKSLVLMDLCHHIASGLPWMTSTPKSNDGVEITRARVLWIDLENGPKLFKRRMKAFAKALDVQFDRGQFQVYSLPYPGLDLSKPENIPAMIDRIKSFDGIDVCIIDHLALTMGAIDENSPQVSQVMNAIRQISEACNLAIALIHHARKGLGKDSGLPEDMLRGSTAILANCDAGFLIERDPMDKDQVTIKAVAVREAEPPIISANFVYEQDDSLSLTSARFWKVAYRSAAARAQDAILEALKTNGKLNQGELEAAVLLIDPAIANKKFRDSVKSLELAGEIFYTPGLKNSKVYQLKSKDDDDE